jgi:2-dehydropantoate 2-reductase
MKTQDTLSALDALAAVAPPSTPVVCAQNGVENERLALRLFEHVYGICVVGGTTHLEPGVVAAESGPVFGSLDIGRFPSGLDDLAVEVSSSLDAGGWVMFPRADVMRWKYTKLLRNLVLAVQALCGPNMRQGAFFDLARAEGERCLDAAGIAYVGNEEWNAARALGPEVPLPPGGRTIGGSSWQSLARGTGSIESAYLNGEIILLGRLHGIPTPANLLLYEMGLRAAATGEAPGSHTEEELFVRLGEMA